MVIIRCIGSVILIRSNLLSSLSSRETDQADISPWPAPHSDLADVWNRLFFETFACSSSILSGVLAAFGRPLRSAPSSLVRLVKLIYKLNYFRLEPIIAYEIVPLSPFTLHIKTLMNH